MHVQWHASPPDKAISVTRLVAHDTYGRHSVVGARLLDDVTAIASGPLARARAQGGYPA